jgi:hypothetical protein
MLCSLIKPNIQYEETTTVDLLDKNTSFEVYEHVLLGIEVELCIGNINNVNKLQNILFCPVYLVKTNNNVIKIGIIEFTPIQMSYIFDDDNNIDLDNVKILLYSFVTPQYINSIINTREEDEEEKQENEFKPITNTVETPKINTINNSNILEDTIVQPTPQQPEPQQTQPEQNISKDNTQIKPKLIITYINEIKLNAKPITTTTRSTNKSRKNKK